MGELVEGVGDEVVLFGGLVLVCFSLLAWFALRGRGRGRQQQTGTTREERVDRRTGSTTESSASNNPTRVDHVDRQTSQTSSHLATDASPLSSPSTGSSAVSNSPHSSVANEQGQDQSASTTGVRQRRHQSSGAQNPQQPTHSPSPPPSPSSPSHTPPSQDAESEEEGAVPLKLVLQTSSMNVRIPLSCTLHQLQRRYFQQQLDERRPVRFILRGRVIEDQALSHTLSQVGLSAHSALHVHIGRPRPPPQGPGGERGEEGNGGEERRGAGDGVDLSGFLLPLMGAILAIVWGSLLRFPHYFSFVSKLFLFFLSLGYAFFTYHSTVAMTNNRRPPAQQPEH